MTMLRRAELPFRTKPVGRLLPGLLAILVYVGVLAIAGAVWLDDTAAAWRGGLSGSLTVELPPAVASGPNAADVAADEIAAALAVLRSEPAIAAATPVAPADVAAMLAPWIGEPAFAADLPMPRLIDVTVREGAPMDVTLLANRLEAAVPGATVDDHGARAGPVLALFQAIEAVVAVVVALITVAVLATVMLATRATVAAHRETIDVLRALGAGDGEIANRYAVQVVRLALAGGLAGAVLAVATAQGLAWMTPPLAASALLLPTPMIWWSLAAAPVTVAALGMITARLTVLGRLRTAF